MRILHVTPTYVPAWRYGGPIRSVHGLCSALARIGVAVEVFTTSVDGPGDLEVALDTPVNIDGVSVRYFRAGILRRLYASGGMARALRARIGEFDLVHLHSVFLWPTWYAARQARRADVPYVLSPRGMLVKSLVSKKNSLLKKAWIAFIEQRNLELAAAIHVTSDTEAEELAKFGMRLRHVFVVPNGIGHETRTDMTIPLEARRVLAAPDPMVLFLGRISWKKGLDRLIQAMANVPGARLLIVGNDEDGYSEQLRDLAQRAGVAQRVVFAGPVYGGAKAELFQRAELFVLPSESENFGITVLEAMAEGCPVVVTKDVGAAGIVHAAGAGRVVGASASELSDAMVDLLSDPVRRRAMGQAGRRKALDEYGWDHIAATMLSHYRGLLGSA